MNENKHIIHQIVHAILFLGKQGLPFHGENEGRSTKKILQISWLYFKCFAESDSILNTGSTGGGGGDYPTALRFLKHICGCHNFFHLSSVQIIIIPACCLLCVL